MFPIHSLMMRFSGAAPSLIGIGALVAGGGMLALILRAMSRRLSGRFNRTRELKPHYARLGRNRPADPCPCGASGPNGTPTYAECCRLEDIKRLEIDCRSFLFQYWSHRSYAGRRWSRPMQARLESFPIPRTVLPDWVRHPERYAFPIDDNLLRRWTPVRPGRRPHRLPEADDDAPL